MVTIGCATSFPDPRRLKGGSVVVGPGAIGLTLATALGAKGGAPVGLVVRGPLRSLLRTEGIYRSGVLGPAAVPPDRLAILDIEEAVAAEPEYLILAVRGPDIVTVVGELKDAGLPLSVTVVCAANGFDVMAPFDALRHHRILRAVVTTGATKLQANAVQITAHGAPLALGPSCEAATELGRRLTLGGLPSEVVRDIAGQAIAKALLNCCVNAPAAIARTTIANVLLTAAGSALVNGVLNEAWEATVGGNGLLSWRSLDEYRQHLLMNVFPQIGRHEPSMLRDLRAGKPTEIEHLNGFVVQAAERLGLRADMNRFVVEAIVSRAVLKLDSAAA